MMTILVRDRRLKKKETLAPNLSPFGSTTKTLTSPNIQSSPVKSVTLLALEFQRAVFSPVFAIFLTDHPSQIHSTEVSPKS